MAKFKHDYRCSQVVQNGEGFLALIKGNEIVGRFTTHADVQAAYRAAVKAAKAART